MNLMIPAFNYLANGCQPAPPCLALRRQPSPSQTAVFGRLGLFATSWLAELGTEARPLAIISDAVQAMLSHLAAILADPGLPQVPRSEAVPREGASTAVRAPGCASLTTPLDTSRLQYDSDLRTFDISASLRPDLRLALLEPSVLRRRYEIPRLYALR